jgi:hypothetical protein
LDVVFLSNILGSGNTSLDISCRTGRLAVSNALAKALKFNYRTEKLTFQAFTTEEAMKLFTDRGLNGKMGKRTRFLHDWFIVVVAQE